MYIRMYRNITYDMIDRIWYRGRYIYAIAIVYDLNLDRSAYFYLKMRLAIFELDRAKKTTVYQHLYL